MDATDAEVEEAAILADIHDTILEFPDKVEQQLRQPETLFCALLAFLVVQRDSIMGDIVFD